jgi:hypothetical protein
MEVNIVFFGIKPKQNTIGDVFYRSSYELGGMLWVLLL